jgi:hypothetical protein
LESESSNLREKHFEATATKLASNQTKLTKADEKFREDPSYIKLVEENNELKDKVKKSDK